MNKRGTFVILVILLLAAFRLPATVPAPPAAASQDDPTPTPPPADDRDPTLPTEQGDYFAASGRCAVCHTRIIDEAGADVSMDTAWRASMMANAARDPYWQATVRGETLNYPQYGAIIEDKCTTCHMPMARFTTVHVNDRAGLLLDDGFGNPDNPLHTLAIEGVSCTLCHQIVEHGLGESESFSGGYVIDPNLPMGRRPAFGPYRIELSQAGIMRDASGFVPVFGLHVEQSEVCATCHTLYTPYLNDEDEIAGEFPEQMVYLEWLYSDYSAEQSCQDCHMPRAEGGAVLSITGGEPRSPLYQHIFAGGNVYILQVLDTFGSDLEVTATAEHFGTKIGDVRDQLQNRTATVAFEDVSLSESGLRAEVRVDSHVGHKFPAGFPSRRAWLHFTVVDAAGRVVFESGAFNPDGFIIGNDNDASAALYEPHYRRITYPDQVQIYETIMRDVNGDVTTTLLRGADYLKDNRLLPAGFAPGDFADVAVIGQATQDADFMAGGDRVTYEVDLGEAEGPFTATAELLFQAVGYRWATNLERYVGWGEAAPEVARFLDYYDAVPNLPVVVASAQAAVEE